MRTKASRKPYHSIKHESQNPAKICLFSIDLSSTYTVILSNDRKSAQILSNLLKSAQIHQINSNSSKFKQIKSNSPNQIQIFPIFSESTPITNLQNLWNLVKSAQVNKHNQKPAESM